MLRTNKPSAAVDENLTLRFIMPVVVEQVLTMANGLIYYHLISTVSASCLAATGIANSVGTIISAIFNLLIIGGTVLLARQIGAGEYTAAAQTVEQSTLLTVLSSVTMAGLCILFSTPLMRLLMPNAEEQLFGEALRYFRILMISVPLWMLQLLFFSFYRALGNSRVPMIAGLLMNAAQTLMAWFFIGRMNLGEVGAGLAYIGCRTVGLLLVGIPLFRDKRFFRLSLRRIFRPDGETCRHILRLGTPNCIESTFVQAGYTVANAMVLALGTFDGSVYQILSTLNTFIGLPQGIVSTIGVTAVGHLLGANQKREARHYGRLIWAGGLAAVTALGTVFPIGARPLSALYSSDAATVDACVQILWIIPVMDLFGVSINAIDAQLRAGGDSRWVMVVTLIAVWLIKLPLTALFTFVFHWGVLGIFAANTLSLVFRAVMGFARHCGDKWMKRV